MSYTIHKGNWLLALMEDYSQFFEPCNWRTFRFCHIEAEDDTMLGAFEITVVILGLGARVRWNHTRTETLEDIEREKDRIMREWGLEDDPDER